MYCWWRQFVENIDRGFYRFSSPSSLIFLSESFVVDCLPVNISFSLLLFFSHRFTRKPASWLLPVSNIFPELLGSLISYGWEYGKDREREKKRIFDIRNIVRIQLVLLPSLCIILPTSTEKKEKRRGRLFSSRWQGSSRERGLERQSRILPFSQSFPIFWSQARADWWRETSTKELRSIQYPLSGQIVRAGHCSCRHCGIHRVAFYSMDKKEKRASAPPTQRAMWSHLVVAEQPGAPFLLEDVPPRLDLLHCNGELNRKEAVDTSWSIESASQLAPPLVA